MKPLATGIWPQHSAQFASLHAAVMDNASRFPGHALAVGSGWSGPKSFFDYDASRALREFIRAVLPADSIWGLDGWVNIMRSGDHIHPHDHVKSHHGGVNTWSGVYYLQFPQNAPRLEVGQVSVLPVPGLMVVFPADTIHHVPPSEFVGERISISFNARNVAP